MSIEWIGVIVLLGIVIFVIIWNDNRKKKEAAETVRSIKSRPGFKGDVFASTHDKSGIAIDLSNECFLLLHGSAWLPKPHERRVPFQKLIAAELVVDEVSVMKTSRGGAVIGALAGGLLGAIVGASVGDKVTHGSRVKKIVLRMTIDDFNRPLHDVVFFYNDGISGRGVGRNSFSYKEKIAKVDKWYARIQAILRKQKSSQVASKSTTISDELEKLANLKERGLLGKDEYARAKAYVLSGGSILKKGD